MSAIALAGDAEHRARPRLVPEPTEGVLMRRVVIAGLVTVLGLTLAAVGADYVVAIRAERSMARALLAAPGMTFEPEVTISGFPVATDVRDRRLAQIGITARGVAVCSACDPAAGVRRADLRATLTDVGVMGAARLIQADTTLRVASISSSATIDSVSMGRFLGVDDLTVTTPAPAGVPGGGGPQDGLLSRTRGVMLTGTVSIRTSPGQPIRRVTVSVTVDLSIVGGRLHVQATGFYTGPQEHSEATVSATERPHVLAAFTATLPAIALPWGVRPTGANSSGSDIQLTARTTAALLTPRQFRPA
ncbi:DUF2993 domain-containing protein [Williamsia sp. CHRR-6]|uniref:LmeA family phospholipid-binding protein n=1 Tax=Williamsia sp. CHRR-6 TaxID=2835871 RepID=UPI001BD9C0C2|nr:DUF2993 domain-containing protein [Williamsia sp. CHRR-6]MBT0566332.1 DUF2993 domain-containing protein [Williamsia sp. CHRR-6]